jgi:hypothetical protein
LRRLDANHWTKDFVVDGFEECRRYFVLTAPVPNASAVLFRKDVYERVGGADEGFRLCGDYKVWAEMALEGKIAYLAEPLNFYRSHGENARTRAQTGSLDVAEFFYVMLSVLKRIAPSDTLTQYTFMNEVLSRRPIELSPCERINASKRSLSYIADWNMGNNPHVAREVIREFLENWEFMLVFREFAICPPGRWRFFVHRYRFYRHSFPEMGWKMRCVNLMRVLGAPVVGYRHRHLPEKVYSRVIRLLAAP